MEESYESIGLLIYVCLLLKLHPVNLLISGFQNDSLSISLRLVLGLGRFLTILIFYTSRTILVLRKCKILDMFSH